MLLGLRSVIYKAPDLAAAKRWYAGVFGIEPYFDEPYYVGFNVGGFELGLDPDIADTNAGAGGATAYWGVSNLDDALTSVASHGATIVMAARDVGGGIKVGSIADPFGNVIGLIENPHFGGTG
jgi:predicted enzyme related to lactoylglutathione lyase